MNKDVTKHRKNITEKEKLTKTLETIEKENRAAISRRPFYWRRSKQPFGYPKDLRNPTRH